MKRRVKKVIKKIEDVYYCLRQDNPDQDEHWLLANTWLSIYGATQQARFKGKEQTTFIAYKETHTFSILESPESIRALALYLVYKELGKAAAPCAHEYEKIMEPVFQAEANRCFFEKYKEKNPKTLSASQREGPGPWSLASFLEGLERFDQDPGFREEVTNIGEQIGE